MEQPCGSEWLGHIRSSAQDRLTTVRYAGVVLSLVAGAVIALVKFGIADPPVPVSVWGWDLAVGVLVAVIWRFAGWLPFHWLREGCRQHVQGVLHDTNLLLDLLSREPSADQPKLWRQVLGSVAQPISNTPLSFQPRIKAFLKHYTEFAFAAGRPPYPPSYGWVDIILFGVFVLGFVFLYMLVAGVPDASNSYPSALTMYSTTWGAWWLVAILAVVEMRQTALELAVTDVLLREE